MALLDDIEANGGMLEWVECLACGKLNRFRKMNLLSREDRYVFVCDECSDREIWQPLAKSLFGDPQKMEGFEAYLAALSLDEDLTPEMREFWTRVLTDAIERKGKDEEKSDDPEAD